MTLVSLLVVVMHLKLLDLSDIDDDHDTVWSSSETRGQDDDGDDIYIMMSVCLFVCLSRKMITSS